jgi:hypothetical protein
VEPAPGGLLCDFPLSWGITGPSCLSGQHLESVSYETPLAPAWRMDVTLPLEVEKMDSLLSTFSFVLASPWTLHGSGDLERMSPVPLPSAWGTGVKGCCKDTLPSVLPSVHTPSFHTLLSSADRGPSVPVWVILARTEHPPHVFQLPPHLGMEFLQLQTYLSSSSSFMSCLSFHSILTVISLVM